MLKDRLKQARKNVGLTQAQVAEAVGMSQPAYQALESGKNTKSSFIPKIAECLKVDTFWLIDGKQKTNFNNFNMQDFMNKHGLAKKDESSFNINEMYDPVIAEEDDERFIWIDVVDVSFSCGTGEAIDFHFDVINGRQPFSPEYFIRKGINPKAVKIILAKGDSMADLIHDNDMVAIDFSQIDIIDGQIYAVYFEGEGMIKQIFKEEGGKLILHSLNPKYRDREITEQNGLNFKVMGRQFWRAG